MRQRRFHPHRVMPENNHSPPSQRHRGNRAVTPVDQRLGGGRAHFRPGPGIGPVADVKRDQLSILADRPGKGMGVNHPRLGAAVAASDIQGRVFRKLLQQRNSRKLGKGPRVRNAHEDIDPGVLKLFRDHVRLGLAVDQHLRINHRHRGLVRHGNRAADAVGHMSNDILGPFTARLVDPRIAGREHSDYRDLRRKVFKFG